ncbi:MAG: serine/threonine-protein kinase [Planctomycetota bacterium]
MKETSISCDPDSLRRLLHGDLDEASVLAIHRHLDRCSRCRDLLDNIAREDFDTTQISEFLIDDELDQESSLSTHNATLDSKPEHSAAVDAVLQHLTASDDPRMLGRFGGYEVIGVIGFGGTGVVLKGYEATLNRYVAIKVLAPHLAISGAARRRFSREGQAAASVLHPNVVSIHRVAEERGLPYLVMPYLGQESLAKRIRDCGPLSITSIVRIAMQIAEGLSAAHRQGLVHRDIKPANILLDKDVERVVITDFGLARTVDEASQTKTAVLAGTPQYMSPEQARGDSVDHRSDLFSVGTVMYTMATGRTPFRGESSYAVLRRIIDEQPTPIRQINPEIAPWLCKLIEKLHAKSPNQRMQTATETAELLRRCLTHQQDSSASLPLELTTRDTTTRWMQGRLTTVAMLFVVLFVASAWTLLTNRNGNSKVTPVPSSEEPTVTPMQINTIHAELPHENPSDQVSGIDTHWIASETTNLFELHNAATKLELDSQFDFFPPKLDVE